MAHEVSGRGVGGLEAVEEHVVAMAVRLAVDRVVGEVVASSESAHLSGAEVMRATATVQPPVCAQVVVVSGYVTCTTPFCTCDQKNKISLETYELYKTTLI